MTATSFTSVFICGEPVTDLAGTYILLTTTAPICADVQEASLRDLKPGAGLTDIHMNGVGALGGLGAPM